MLRGTKAGFDFDEDNSGIVHSSGVRATVWTPLEGTDGAIPRQRCCTVASLYLRTNEVAC